MRNRTNSSKQLEQGLITMVISSLLSAFADSIWHQAIKGQESNKTFQTTKRILNR